MSLLVFESVCARTLPTYE